MAGRSLNKQRGNMYLSSRDFLNHLLFFRSAKEIVANYSVKYSSFPATLYFKSKHYWFFTSLVMKTKKSIFYFQLFQFWDSILLIVWHWYYSSAMTIRSWTYCPVLLQRRQVYLYLFISLQGPHREMNRTGFHLALALRLGPGILYFLDLSK